MVVTFMLIVGYVLILRMPSEISKQDYYFRIWIIIVSACLSYLLMPKKNK
jgi:bacteriorhodopsin